MPKLAQVNFLPTPKLWRDFRSSETHLGVLGHPGKRADTSVDPAGRSACATSPPQHNCSYSCVYLSGGAMPGTHRYAIGALGGAFRAPRFFISYPLLHGHVHRALHFL